MVNDGQTAEKQQTAKDQHNVEDIIRRNLEFVAEELAQMFEKSKGGPKSIPTLISLVGAFAPYISVRSAERLEGVTDRIHRESKRMTVLTIFVVALTVMVAVLSVIQVWHILAR